jgi:hypothetical protein
MRERQICSIRNKKSASQLKSEQVDARSQRRFSGVIRTDEHILLMQREFLGN